MSVRGGVETGPWYLCLWALTPACSSLVYNNLHIIMSSPTYIIFFRMFWFSNACYYPIVNDLTSNLEHKYCLRVAVEQRKFLPNRKVHRSTLRFIFVVKFIESGRFIELIATNTREEEKNPVL
jgi:hypothetical protein